MTPVWDPDDPRGRGRGDPDLYGYPGENEVSNANEETPKNEVAPADLFESLGWDDEQQQVSFADLLLGIDTKQGRWKIGDVTLGDEIALVFIARRYTRTLFGRPFDPKNPQSGFPVCGSVDGYDGFGIGRELGPTEHGHEWRKLCKPRQCVERGNPRNRICPMASGRGDAWKCRPQFYAMVMFRQPGEGTVWQQAFLRTRGMMFGVCEDAFTQVFNAMQQTRRVGEDGKARPDRLIYSWVYKARIVESRNGKDYDMQFGRPVDLPPREFARVDEWAQENAAKVWQQDREDAREHLLQLAEIPEDADPTEGNAQPGGYPDAPPPEEPASFDEVPF